ncbi:MAG: hypothetical protein DMG57_41195 [Acidobacteria bacterium]|nr:MAG: hypothetical protein DMG57_41195 [Acidobacteriota bacterium]
MAPARARELRIHSPDGQTKTIELKGERITLGRSTGTVLPFPEDAGLSRQHLAFERDGEEWLLRDLGSKNGTLLNSNRISAPSVLRSGDRITAGHLLMVYDDPSARVAPAGVEFVEREDNPPTTSTTLFTNLNGILSTGQTLASAGAVQMSALIRAGNELAEDRPLPDLFRIILDLSIEAVGAQRGVLMTPESGGQLQVQAARGNAFRISTAVRDRVLKTRDSILISDVQLDDAFRLRQSIVEQRVRTFMAVPLQTKERIIGLIYVDSPTLTRVFTKDDLNLLTVMANTAAVRIEHARLAEIEHQERIMKRDLQQAADIQRSFLPAVAPQLPGLDLTGYNAPCRTVGGDYYDFFPYPNGRVAMVLGDVSGKGMPASLLMMSLQARVQVLIEEPEVLGAVMTRLNRLTATNCPANRFITFFMCVLDAGSGDLVYCSAGHNPPLLVRAKGKLEWLDFGNMPLGIIPATKYEETRERLSPGDVLVIYSDGVTDATNPQDEEFGEQRLAAVVSEHRTETSGCILEAVNAAIAQWAAGTPLPDDLTLIVARRAN